MKYSRPLYSIDNLIFDSNTKSYNYISQRERLLEVLVASGTFTQANARLSLVDGTAFFDCGADLSAYAGLDSGSHEYLIKVYDDDGNSIQGYVGAVGGGETLGGEALTTWTNRASPNDFETLTSVGVDITSGINDVGTTGYASNALTNSLTNKRLYKLAKNLTLNSGQAPYHAMFAAATYGQQNNFEALAAGAEDEYFVVDSATYNYLVVWMNTAVASNFSCTFSLKNLTDCAATGFHIISVPGGSTQNWQNVSASFNYNDGDGYSYKIYAVAPDPFEYLPSDDNLVGYWPFNETSGTNAPDESGNGNNGTLVNMEDADWVDGVVGKCLDFDGVDEYVNLGTSVLNNLPIGSISLWLNPTALTTTFRYPIGSNSLAGGNLSFRIDTGGGCWWTVDNSTISGGLVAGTFAIDNWYHVVMTWDGTTWQFFIDSVEVDSVVNANGTSSAGNSVWIGDAWDGLPWSGLIDEVRIYSTALTASEIKALYAYPAGR